MTRALIIRAHRDAVEVLALADGRLARAGTVPVPRKSTEVDRGELRAMIRLVAVAGVDIAAVVVEPRLRWRSRPRYDVRAVQQVARGHLAGPLVLLTRTLLRREGVPQTCERLDRARTRLSGHESRTGSLT